MKNYAKDLEKLFQDVLIQEKRSRKIFSYYIILPVIFGIGILYVTLKSNNDKIKVEKKLEILQQYSEEQKNAETINAIVIDYVKLRSLHNTTGLDKLYNDNIELYFKLKNITKKDILKADSIYWSKRRTETYILQEVPQISRKDNNFIALTKVSYCKDNSGTKCRNLIFEIRLDKNYKIYYVDAYQLADIQNLYK